VGSRRARSEGSILKTSVGRDQGRTKATMYLVSEEIFVQYAVAMLAAAPDGAASESS
jgi:hypothetical protein